MSVSLRRPKEEPSLSVRMDITLSTITKDGLRRPFSTDGSMARRTRRERSRAVAEVIGRTATVVWFAKKSDWITRAGRGLPNPPGRVAVMRSPRFTSNRRDPQTQHPGSPSIPDPHDRQQPSAPSGADTPLRTLAHGYRESRFVRGADPPHGGLRDASEPAGLQPAEQQTGWTWSCSKAWNRCFSVCYMYHIRLSIIGHGHRYTSRANVLLVNAWPPHAPLKHCNSLALRHRRRKRSPRLGKAVEARLYYPWTPDPGARFDRFQACSLRPAATIARWM